MESSLHRSLKERYAAAAGGRFEVSLQGYRIDAVDGDGRLVEVQSGSLGPLCNKLTRLLPEHRVRIVKPVILRRRLIRFHPSKRAESPARSSPKRGDLHDVFEDLVGFVRVFPHANLEIEVLGVTIDELRSPRRRRPGYKIVDRRLASISQSVVIARADDLWSLLPEACVGREPFTTQDLAHQLGRPEWFAQKVAYCLRQSGAARPVAKKGNRIIYVRRAVDSPCPGIPQRTTDTQRNHSIPLMPKCPNRSPLSSLSEHV